VFRGMINSTPKRLNENRVLDLFCGAGGACKGLQNLGFEVIGIDVFEHKNYPGILLKQDVLTLEPKWINDNFGAVHASCPCQMYTPSTAQWKQKGYEYPDLIEDTRKLLLKSELPFVMENVTQAPLRKDLELCGVMFGLPLYRHRIFEIEGFEVPQPEHQKHEKQQKIDSIYGKARRAEQIQKWRYALECHWMNEGGLGEAIPPRYTEFIFSHLPSFMKKFNVLEAYN